MTEKRETRFVNFSEIRVDDTGGAMKIGGYAAVFDKEAVIYDLFREKIARGAFADSLKTDDVRAFWSHNSELVLGRTSNGTLKLKEDERGLGFELDLPDTSLGRDSFVSIKRGDVDGVSIGFQTVTHEWTRGKENELHLRTIKSAKLYEISPVAFPAYKETEVSARSLDEGLVKEVEASWAVRQKELQDALAEKREQIAKADIKVRRFLLNFAAK